MDFKRALVRGLKGVFCKLKGRLLEAKKHVLIFKSIKIVYKLQLIREYVVCRRQIDIWVFRILE